MLNKTLNGKPATNKTNGTCNHTTNVSSCVCVRPSPHTNKRSLDEMLIIKPSLAGFGFGLRFASFALLPTPSDASFQPTRDSQF